MKLIRFSKCSLKFAIYSKLSELKRVLSEYGRVCNVFIGRFWKNSTPSKSELLKEIVDLPSDTMTHYLRIYPQYFSDVMNGIKNFEVRRDDRKFSVEDNIVLQEYNNGEYTGRKINCKVIYKLDGGQFGIEYGYCVLGIKIISKE